MSKPNVTVIISDAEGNEQELSCKDGSSILEIAREHDLPLDGECEGTLSCSTCHVVIDPDYYGKLPVASTDEEDMLSVAHNVTCTSRLGCQVRVHANLNGIKITLPEVNS